MNITFYASEVSSQVSQISLASIPSTLWALYLEYLWFYEPDSWVARIAYSCRVLAVLVSLPVIILGLLDIASYGIARTLGVIDDVKASTSDKATIHTESPPSIQLNGAASPPSDSDINSDSNDTHKKLNVYTGTSTPSSSTSTDSPSEPPVFYAGEGKLSGVGVFSPAASLPPSPTISRRHLPIGEQASEHLRHRTPQTKETDTSSTVQYE
ncbi:hypothetical protein CPB84DRAFT_1814445 [Gymnopilus junonius]|uniref:Uncharacterized protein n=1 Tax=Gymnopilus junonius TaxID=109634 RepID=A0A9P5NT41_GYMJU|nr:hypothetical protein CPB84DRAFT_1814445 [Gymnopilus junonius]